MRISMNVIKNECGVFHVRKKVPKKLEAATATVMGSEETTTRTQQRGGNQQICDGRHCGGGRLRVHLPHLFEQMEHV